MSRYVVRFLVAVLTFSIGIALSLALGLLTPRAHKAGGFYLSTSCGRHLGQFSPLLANPSDGPLGLRFVSTVVDLKDQDKLLVTLRVHNSGNREITGYTISCGREGASNRQAPLPVFLGTPRIGWEDISLEEGATRFVTVRCDVDQFLNLRVESVNFGDGSTWNNPGS
jgi:hypothetical protein